MLKPTIRFACLALLMFAASASPLTSNATSQFDGPNPYPPVPPAPSCMPAPCPVGVVK
jgi:hypothetical protein